jgi:hypothetical protein
MAFHNVIHAAMPHPDAVRATTSSMPQCRIPMPWRSTTSSMPQCRTPMPSAPQRRPCRNAAPRCHGVPQRRPCRNAVRPKHSYHRSRRNTQSVTRMLRPYNRARSRSSAFGHAIAPGDNRARSRPSAFGHASAPGHNRARSRPSAFGHAIAPGDNRARSRSSAFGHAIAPGHDHPPRHPTPSRRPHRHTTASRSIATPPHPQSIAARIAWQRRVSAIRRTGIALKRYCVHAGSARHCASKNSRSLVKQKFYFHWTITRFRGIIQQEILRPNAPAGGFHAAADCV